MLIQIARRVGLAVGRDSGWPNDRNAEGENRNRERRAGDQVDGARHGNTPTMTMQSISDATNPVTGCHVIR